MLCKYVTSISSKKKKYVRVPFNKINSLEIKVNIISKSSERRNRYYYVGREPIEIAANMSSASWRWNAHAIIIPFSMVSHK